MTAVAIVGSRDFKDLDLVRRFVEGLDDGSIVVSGGARGVDAVAVRSALACGFTVQVFKADWERHGRAAGVIRNEQIVRVSDRVAAFWDGKSKGTHDTIKKAQKAGKQVVVYGSDGEVMDVGPRQREMF